MTFTPDDGSEPIQHVVHNYGEDGGVAQVQHNVNDSIRGFARACFNYGLMRHYPCTCPPKNTILKAYDGQRSRTPSPGVRDRVQGQVRGRRFDL